MFFMACEVMTLWNLPGITQRNSEPRQVNMLHMLHKTVTPDACASPTPVRARPHSCLLLVFWLVLCKICHGLCELRIVPSLIVLTS